MSGDLRFLSLCSGAGGLDVGLAMAGWEPLTQIEIDRDCCRTLEANNAKSSRPARAIHVGIETINPRELRLSLGLARGELKLIAGGPPCQPFTTHGLRQTLSDERAGSVFPSYLDFIREFEPETLVIENVDGFLSAALEHVPLVERELRPLGRREMKGSFLEWVLVELDKLGYSVSWGVGTHGWLLRRGNRAVVSMNAKIRPDHVWALEDGQFTVATVGRSAGYDQGGQGRLRRSA